MVVIRFVILLNRWVLNFMRRKEASTYFKTLGGEIDGVRGSYQAHFYSDVENQHCF